MSSSPVILEAFLTRCRWRLLGMELAVGGALIGCTLLGVGLLACAVFVLSGSLGILRTLLQLLAIVGIGVSCWQYLFLPWLRWRSPDRLAREVEKRLLDGELDLVSAVQLERMLPDLLQHPTVSPDLALAHVERMAGRIENLDAGRLVSRRRLVLPVGFFGLMLAGAVLLSVLEPESFRGALAALISPDRGQVPAGPQGPSWLGDIRITYRYPAYSGREDRVLEGTDGSILALPGTEVGITSLSDRELRAAQLKLEKVDVPLAVEGGRQVSGQLVVMKAGSYRFELEDVQGSRWSDDRNHPIHLEVDRAPEVVLYKPAADLVIRENDSVDLAYDAQDDYGLSEVRLVYRVSDRSEGEQRQVLRQVSGRTRRLNRESHHWDLSVLRLVPGEQLQFYLEATDNDTVLGPKVGRSATHSLKVFSADEQHRDLMGRVQALWEKLLVRLGDGLDQEPSVRTAKEEDPAATQKDYQEMEPLLKEVVRLQQELRQDRQAWQPLLSALANVWRGLTELQQESQWLQVYVGARAEEERQQANQRILAAQRGKRIGELERDVLYLEDLLDRVRLEELAHIAKDLADARERLSKLLEDYRKAPTEEARKQIEAEIARLKQRIQDLLKRQAEVVKAMRDEYFNPEAMKKLLSDRDMMAELDKIQQLLNEGKFDEAAAELSKLQRQLDQLQAGIERARQSFGQGKYQELAQAIGRIQGELNQIIETQRRVMDHTGMLRQQVMDRLRQQWGPKFGEILEKLRQRLKNVVAKLQAIPLEALSAFPAQDRSEALEQARALDMLLKAMDLAGSLEASRKLSSVTGQLSETLKADEFYEGRSDPKRREEIQQEHHQAQEAHAGAEAIQDELEKILPKPGDMLGGEERSQIEKLLREQSGLEGRLRSLQRQMEEINGKAPLFGQDLLGGMERGGRSMGRAAGELGAQDPRAAYPHQQSAMSELEKAKQAMQKGGKGEGGGMPIPMGGESAMGQDYGGPGGDMSREPVEIPKPEDFQAPAAFRKELLEGMKDPVPEAFKAQVRKYYEELVK